jgi:16S rRNA (guanine966-N2)-methyltransferase
LNQLRIIAGLWRGRKIRFADHVGLRPTADRIRETLFNWLQWNITSARCLDLFGGSGALSFEAASRGAHSVICVESDSSVSDCIRENLENFSHSQIELVQQDALAFLNSTRLPYKMDIVFLDPPFAAGLLAQSCQLLEENAWLTTQALIYLESAEALEALQLPENWRLIKSKKAGQVYYGLCQREES